MRSGCRTASSSATSKPITSKPMSNENQNEYEVGYKKPPVATRFKKGGSGNPSGKRKERAEDLDPGKVLQTIDNEEIMVTIDSKRKRMRKGETHARQLFTKT